MRNVGMMMLLLDDSEDCARWMSGAVRGNESNGKRDRAAAYMRAQLARCYLRGGRTIEGIALLTEAVGALEEVGDDTNRYAANAKIWLATAYLENQEAERAEPLAASAVEYYRRTTEASHPARAEAECELAQVLAARGRSDAALVLAQACVPRIATYGQMVPWRKWSAEGLLRRLTGDRHPRQGLTAKGFSPR